METKSAWVSKINATQAVAVLAMLLTMFGADLDTETQAEVVAFIMSGQAVATWVMRTWFTKKLTKASMK